MAANHQYPSWALEHRKPGTELRFISNKYYLYEVSSYYDAELKKSRKKTGSLLGTIKEGIGFVPSGKKELKDKVAKSQVLDPNSISVREFGFTSFLTQYNQDIREKLNQYFPDFFEQIIYMAYCRIAYHSTLSRMDLHIAKSYLSISDKKKYSDKDFSNALRAIGKNREAVTKYMKSFIQPNEHILVDMTNIFSASNNMRYSKEGYNSDMIFDKQFNLLYIYSATLQQPVFYKIYGGNIKDVSGFQLCLQESGIEDAVIIADKGFYSVNNFAKITDSKLKIIVPLRRDNKAIEYSKVIQEEMEYFRFEDRYIWHIKYPFNQGTIFLFLDERLKVNEKKDYLDRIEKLPEDFTIEGFKAKQNQFGTIAMITNIESPDAEDIYTSYKSRNEVEVMFDGYKNILKADRTYMQDEDALEGYMLVNHIAIQWYYIIYKLLKENKMLKKYSVTDFVKLLIEVKKVRINDVWYKEPIIKRIQTLLDKLKISIP
jgi:transposase